MGNRTLVLSGSAFSREAEHTVYIPDMSPTENARAYERRVEAFLNHQYGIGHWREPERTRESVLMELDLKKASQLPSLKRQLERLQRRAKRSLRK